MSCTVDVFTSSNWVTRFGIGVWICGGQGIEAGKLCDNTFWLGCSICGEPVGDGFYKM